MMEISKRNIIIISTIFILVFMAVANLSAESIWEGSAAMGRYGEFPFTGYYGASNSFPQNAFVEVENLENGKRTRVIIVDRLSDSGLLMLVSNEAAQELGIYQNDIARIKVRILTTGNTMETLQADDLAYNPDPDLNPAAALMTTEELLLPDTPDVNKESEPEVEVVDVIEPEVEREVEPEPELDLTEAEILVFEEEIPADIVVDTPEKPFDWPDTVKVVPEEVEPTAENESRAVEMSSSEAEEIKMPVQSLELLSSGLGYAEPVNSEEDNLSMSSLPELTEKVSEEDVEYLTEASDYYNPMIKEAGISIGELPVPEPEIPEEVIAVLVGDHLLFSETEPENVEVDDAFYDMPEIVELDENSAAVLTLELRDADPIEDDGTTLIAEAFPSLPGGDDSILVEVANGYISPGKAEYTGEIKDYPDYAGASEPMEVPNVKDELVYSDAPVSDGTSDLPEMTVVPEVVKAIEDAATEEESIAEAVPEYDENVEISLVPAEVRPPELVEEEMELEESEPEIVEAVEVDIAKDEPEIQQEETSVSEEAVIRVAVETEELELKVPSEVMMVTKLQQQRHYLQLGAFKEKNSAIKAAGKLEAVYPVTILTDETTASYKLLLGPLSADESGIMLYNFRAGGYSDAFIRRIE